MGLGLVGALELFAVGDGDASLGITSSGADDLFELRPQVGRPFRGIRALDREQGRTHAQRAEHRSVSSLVDSGVEKHGMVVP